MTVRNDIETALILMLSVNGLALSAKLSGDDRRERIRSVIIEQNLKDRPYDAEISYGEAYRLCYFRSVALRSGAPPTV